MSDNKNEIKGDKVSGNNPPFPKIDFSTFLNSLAASAFVHLGLINDPVTGGNIKNPDMAKQTIDIITMLEEKTKNNLLEEEKNLLINVLHDLRMHYVKEAK